MCGPGGRDGGGQGGAPGGLGGGYSNIIQVSGKKVPPHSVLAKLGREPQLKVPSGTFNWEWPLFGSCRTKWRPAQALGAILACSWGLLGPLGPVLAALGPFLDRSCHKVLFPKIFLLCLQVLCCSSRRLIVPRVSVSVQFCSLWPTAKS